MTTTDLRDETLRPRRPFNVAYLVIGVIFLGISGIWALHENGSIDLIEVKYAAPLVLIVAGVVGLLASAARGIAKASRPAYDAAHTAWTPPVDPVDQTLPLSDLYRTPGQDDTSTEITGENR